MTVTAPLWRQIEQTLTAEIGEGRYPPGSRLPSEADLARRFGVNRHTVRRAQAAMQDAGLVMARRGAGVYVTGTQLSYRLGRRTRFTQNLAEIGRIGSRTILRLETLPAGAAEAAALGLAPGAMVHVLEDVGAADGVPIAYARSVLPAAALPGFAAAMRRTGSITAALAAAGIADYRRRATRLRADRASGEMARHLRLPEGAPVLRTDSLNETPDGRAIEHGRTWFASDRVELVIDDESFR